MWQKTFRESFCERFDCAPEEYEKRVFWRCLYRRSLPLSLLVYSLKRHYFNIDRQTIRQLGLARSTDEFRTELENLRYAYRLQGGLLRSLRVRVSSKRLMALLRAAAPPREQRAEKEKLVNSA